MSSLSMDQQQMHEGILNDLRIEACICPSMDYFNTNIRAAVRTARFCPKLRAKLAQNNKTATFAAIVAEYCKHPNPSARDARLNFITDMAFFQSNANYIHPEHADLFRTILIQYLVQFHAASPYYTFFLSATNDACSSSSARALIQSPLYSRPFPLF